MGEVPRARASRRANVVFPEQLVPTTTTRVRCEGGIIVDDGETRS
jgi:hypothetical protein